MFQEVQYGASLLLGKEYRFAGKNGCNENVEGQYAQIMKGWVGELLGLRDWYVRTCMSGMFNKSTSSVM